MDADLVLVADDGQWPAGCRPAFLVPNLRRTPDEIGNLLSRLGPGAGRLALAHQPAPVPRGRRRLEATPTDDTENHHHGDR
jgi:hypothetical protein